MHYHVLAFACGTWILGKYQGLIDTFKKDMYIGSIVGQTTKHHRIADDATRPDIRHKRIICNAYTR